MWRLTAMQTPIRPIASIALRSVFLVALAMMLILVLLPAALTVQASQT